MGLEIKVDNLQRENAELRAKLEAAEKEIERRGRLIEIVQMDRDFEAGKGYAAEQQLGEANASVAQMRAALESALHGLSTTHNLLATDRPDLMPTLPEDLVWMIDNSKEIKTIRQALSTAPSQAAERQKRLIEAAKAVDREMRNPENCNVPSSYSMLGRTINGLIAAIKEAE